MDADAVDDASEIILRVPACDICRSRKAPEKKQRVLLSSKYDEGLAQVNRRLEELSGALQSLLETSKSKTTDDRVPVQNHGPLSDAASNVDEGEATYEGDSSFHAHSKSITQKLGVSLASPSVNPSSSSTPSIDQAAIEKLLKDVAAAQAPVQQSSVPQHRLSQFLELSSLALPSMSLVLKLLRVAENTLQRWFIDYQLMDYTSFKAVCQSVYFPTEEYSIYTWIIVNGGLFYLLRDGDGDLHEKLGIDRTEIKANLRICKHNVDVSIHALRLCIDPSLEACQALILGASMAMEDAKAALAWKLSSTASRMCLDLGLHRLPRDDAPDNFKKRMTFWSVYSMDKGLAFNFGRTPTDPPRCPEDLGGICGILYAATLDLAVLQGEIYEQLFSTHAQKQSEACRIQRARDFATKIQELRQPVLTFTGAGLDLPNKDMVTYALLSADILIGCMLAIIYRVIPPQQPAHPLQYCDEAVTNSRSALRSLHAVWIKLQEDSNNESAETWELFLNWTILFVPFVPFVVLFGNCIAQSNHDDLDLLRTTASTLEGIADRSPAGHKLCSACSRFIKIAEVLLAQDTMKRSSSQPSPIPVDPYTVDFQMLPDFPVSQQDWDGMLDDFDLGLGAESAREMTSYFEPFMTGNQNAFN